MKKNYFMLAAATMMFAACAETDLVNEINVTESVKQEAIGFEAFANKTTRAEITDLAGLQRVGFNVWGYKYEGNSEDFTWVDLYLGEDGNLTSTQPDDETEPNKQATTTYTIFNGVGVTYNGVSWEYTGTQYWDQTMNYNFYAVSPQADINDNSPYSIDNGLITIVNANHNTDYLLVRKPKTVAGSLKSPVQLDFNHIMSKISFKLKAGVGEIIQVTSLSMSGYHNGTGEFQQDADFEASTRTHTEWTLNNANNDGNTNNFVTNEDVLILDGTTTNVSASSVLKSSFIMMPQQIAKNTLTFTISYNILTEDNSGTISFNEKKYKIKETFENQTGKLTTEQNWNTDTHTTYTIVVTPDAIEFGDPTIDEWSEIEDRGNEPENEDEKNEDNLRL